MTVNAGGLIIPGKGAVFTAPVNTPCPANPLSLFSLSGTAPSGWDNLGHTSKQNTISFAREGGEATALDSFLADSVRVFRSSVAWSLNVQALQIDGNTLDLAFNGDWDYVKGGYVIPAGAIPTETALFVLLQDSSGKLGFYIPNNSISLGDAISIDTENFLELPLSASILAAATDVLPAVDGTPGLMEVFKSGLIAPTATAWAATTEYEVDALVSLGGGAILRATVAGESGGTAPTAPESVGLTVTDGTVTWVRVA
ncbi:hypothetical protein ACSHWG_00905 [Leucobacter sp. Z1108]|uniref:phage tail tube protein n=1 Tax=Leucobacter sp. Z1108 TaxID=3439066 RepID=UPI003F2A3999